MFTQKVLERFAEKRDEFLKKYPENKVEILDYFYLALNEINEGASPDNEYVLFENSLEEMILNEQELQKTST